MRCRTTCLRRLQRHPQYARGTSKKRLETLGAANGQHLLFRRDAYEAIGGHAAVRDHLVEDVALGRLVAARTDEGMVLINCDGSQLLGCRMYTCFAEVWEGFTKNLRAAFAESAFSFWMFGALQTAGLLLPFVLACLPGVQRTLVVVAGDAGGVGVCAPGHFGNAVQNFHARRIDAPFGAGVVAAHRSE